MATAAVVLGAAWHRSHHRHGTLHGTDHGSGTRQRATAAGHGSDHGSGTRQRPRQRGTAGGTCLRTGGDGARLGRTPLLTSDCLCGVPRRGASSVCPVARCWFSECGCEGISDVGQGVDGSSVRTDGRRGALERPVMCGFRRSNGRF